MHRSYIYSIGRESEGGRARDRAGWEAVGFILSVFFVLGAFLASSWAVLGALETLLGRILSDLGSLQHVLRRSLYEIWSKQALYVGF